MPIHWEPLDSSIREENVTIILGKTILLKIIDDPDKQSLLKNSIIKKFVSIPHLCSNNVRQFIGELIEQEALLTAPRFVQNLMQKKDELVSLSQHANLLQQLFAPVMESKFMRNAEERLKKRVREEEEDLKELGNQQDLLSDFLLRAIGKVSRKDLRKREKNLIALSEELRKKTGFKILVQSSISLCPRCKVILPNNEIIPKKCYICNREIDENHLLRISIYKIPEEIKNIWRSNLWFEEYCAGLLRKLGYKTRTSVHAMGVSGILHQVDVLAIRNGTVIVCECKTGKISRNDVFSFCTKMSDLKVHISILALIGELPEIETREFVKRNPTIIGLENMSESTEAEVLKNLEQRLFIKG